MKRTVRNILIKTICYLVVMGILLTVLGLIYGWSADKLISEIIAFTLGWIVVTLITTLLEMKDKKENKENTKKKKRK